VYYNENCYEFVSETTPQSYPIIPEVDVYDEGCEKCQDTR
jgi:hypothetical protein